MHHRLNTPKRVRTLALCIGLLSALALGPWGRAQGAQPLFLPLVRTEPCTGHRASLELSAAADALVVGDVVTVTLTLRNNGCVGLGVPLYRLAIASDTEEPGLIPLSPTSVTHYYGVAPGGSDEAHFVLEAAAAGSTALRGSVSYEVHLGYPGPAYWAGSASEALVITVSPADPAP